MAWLVFTIVLLLLAIGAFFWPGPYSKLVGGLALVVWLVLTFFMSLHNVGQREVGIVYNFSGTIAGKKDAGVVMTWPWQHIKKENIGIQHLEYELDASNSAVSNDQQPVFAKLAVNLQVDPEKVVDLYKRIGPGWKNILLESRVLQDFKEITASFPTVEITNSREQLRQQFRERLANEMEKYDIRIIDVFVRNIGFSQAYSEAIQQKLVAQQESLRATFKANAVKAAADGEAYAIRVKGAALRENPQSLQDLAIRSLAKNVQLIVCTGNTCPSFIPAQLTTAGRR